MTCLSLSQEASGGFAGVGVSGGPGPRPLPPQPQSVTKATITRLSQPALIWTARASRAPYY